MGGDEFGVFGRQFDAAGNALTDEILINTTTRGNQKLPDIALQDDGSVLIAWESDHTGSGLGDICTIVLDINSHQVSEGAANGTVVCQVSADDKDGDAITYALLNDAGGRFTINSTTGEIVVANGDLLDYETDKEHILRVRVADSSGMSSERDVVVQCDGYRRDIYFGPRGAAFQFRHYHPSGRWGAYGRVV